MQKIIFLTTFREKMVLRYIHFRKRRILYVNFIQMYLNQNHL